MWDTVSVMAKLSASTVTINDGDILLYKRKRSSAWQAKFKIGSRWVRTTTKLDDLDKAKRAAKDLFTEYQFKEKHELPVITRRFADVARYVIADMRTALNGGGGKKVFEDYITALDRYLIPYFGKKHVGNIGYDDIKGFDTWRKATMKRDPKASTINTHNSALNRVFTEAVARGYMSKNQVPSLLNKGRDAERRPDFNREEYRILTANFAPWIAKSRKGKSNDMRLLLRDYVLILANTGMRPGTETDNLLWQHVNVFKANGQDYLEMSVTGKTGRRDIICRANTVNYLKRIHERCDGINGMTFEQLLKAKIDKPVFRLPDGTASMNLRQTFKAYLKEIGLLKCPRTGLDRTLYSLRHMYATFALIDDGMEIHTLAKQMGTSIAMIERHYSHLTPRLKKDMLTGKRYQLAGGVNADQDDDGE